MELQKMPTYDVHQAVHQNNIEQLKLLLQSGGDVNQLENEKTPLYVAIERKCQVELIKLLLQHDADMNAGEPSNGYKPLHLAALVKSNENILKLLLDYGADIESRNYYKSTPLHLACWTKDNIVNVKFLIAHGAKVNELDEFGSTPLHLANLYKSDFELVQLLVEKGAQINAKNNMSETPLHLATEREDNFEIINFLLQHGAEVNAETQDKTTPFGLANCIKNNAKVVDLLLKHGAVFVPNNHQGLLIKVCLEGNLEAVRWLVENGVDVNEKDYVSYRSPLYYILLTNNRYKMDKFLLEQVIKVLIHFGVNINARYDKGDTLLHTAVWKSNSFEKITILLEHGAEVNVKNDFDATPFHDIITTDNFETTRLLLQHGADPSASTKLINFINNGDKYKFDLFNEQPDNRINQYNIKLIHNLIRLKMLNLISEKQFSTWKTLNIYQRSYVKNFEKTCKMEVKKLKNELLCSDHVVTLADILTKTLRKCAVYLQVKEIQNRLNETDYDERFPIYSAMLKERIEKANCLADVLHKGYQSLNYILTDYFSTGRIPHVFLHQTLSYLKDHYVDNLNAALKPPEFSV